MRDFDERERVCQAGTAAWRRLKKCKSWSDWLQVGEAILVGRDCAMNQALTNRPEGKAYNMAMSEWLQRYKLDDMDKGDRSRLFEIMGNLANVEQWRSTLTLTQRLALNHPNAVLRKFKAAAEPARDPADKKPTVRETLAQVLEDGDGKDREIVELKARIVELEEELTSARDTIAARDQHIARLERKPRNWES